MDEDKIIVSNRVLESMKKKLQNHCKECSLYVNRPEEMCFGCSVLDVADTLRVMICGDVNEWN